MISLDKNCDIQPIINDKSNSPFLFRRCYIDIYNTKHNNTDNNPKECNNIGAVLGCRLVGLCNVWLAPVTQALLSPEIKALMILVTLTPEITAQ